MAAANKKRILYVQRRAPYGTLYAQEALEMLSMGAAFGQRVGIAFLDDGVFQLKAEQTPGALGMKNSGRMVRALELHDLEGIYVEQESLVERNLEPGQLVLAGKVLPRVELSQLMAEQDLVLSF